jgi:hypothetical protein
MTMENVSAQAAGIISIVMVACFRLDCLHISQLDEQSQNANKYQIHI